MQLDLQEYRKKFSVWRKKTYREKGGTVGRKEGGGMQEGGRGQGGQVQGQCC